MRERPPGGDNARIGRQVAVPSGDDRHRPAGRAGGRQGHPGAGARGPARRPGARLGRPAADGRRRRHAARTRGRSLHESRSARSGRHHRARLPRSARGAGRRQRGDPRRLPADEGPGRGARRRAGRSRPPRRPRRATSTSRSRTSSSAWPTAGSAPPTATSTTSSRTRPQSTRSATSTARTSSSAPDDAEETVRARMAQQVPPLLEVVEHYRDKGVLTTVDGRQGDRRGHRGA